MKSNLFKLEKRYLKLHRQTPYFSLLGTPMFLELKYVKNCYSFGCRKCASNRHCPLTAIFPELRSLGWQQEACEFDLIDY